MALRVGDSSRGRSGRVYTAEGAGEAVGDGEHCSSHLIQ